MYLDAYNFITSYSLRRSSVAVEAPSLQCTIAAVKRALSQGLKSCQLLHNSTAGQRNIPVEKSLLQVTDIEGRSSSSIRHCHFSLAVRSNKPIQIKPRICVLFILCLTWMVNANSLKQNIILIKEICSWLPPWLDEQEEILFTERYDTIRYEMLY